MSIFTKVAAPKVKHSAFNLSSETKLSCNFGDLVPIMCQETLPGDKFKISTELLIKLAPLKAPVMHRVKAYVHYFFVPKFQINSNFEKFINPKLNSDNSIVPFYISPTLIKLYGQLNYNSGGYIGTLSDYLGLPIMNSNWLEQNAAGGGFIDVDPFRAYQHIYNSYYRDENLEVLEGANESSTGLFLVEKYLAYTGLFNNTGNVAIRQLKNLMKLRSRGWAKDYFTSALPTPQAGDDVLIPITNIVSSDGEFKLQADDTTEGRGFNSTEVLIDSNGAEDMDDDIGTLKAYDDQDTPHFTKLHYSSGLKVTNSSATINDLRRAMALQRFKELAERGGTRYSEMVRNFYGAFLKDYWVDRPIYLGGQVQDIKIGEVVQTSASATTTLSGSSYSAFLGERGGIGQSYGHTKTVKLSSPCHGYVIGILSIRPVAEYYQGLERMWTRKSIFDYAFPQFANMGEQEIYNKELFANGDSTDEGVFGYTPRYAEYKTGHCHICGDFRNTLSYWHFGRSFSADSRPTLSKAFVMMDNVSYSPFAVTDSSVHHCYVDLYNSIFARRPLPYFGTPSII